MIIRLASPHALKKFARIYHFYLRNQAFCLFFHLALVLQIKNMTCHTLKRIRILCRFTIWPLKCQKCLRFRGNLTFPTTFFIYEFLVEILTLSEKVINLPKYISEDISTIFSQLPTYEPTKPLEI